MAAISMEVKKRRSFAVDGHNLVPARRGRILRSILKEWIFCSSLMKKLKLRIPNSDAGGRRPPPPPMMRRRRRAGLIKVKIFRDLINPTGRFSRLQNSSCLPLPPVKDGGRFGAKPVVSDVPY